MVSLVRQHRKRCGVHIGLTAILIVGRPIYVEAHETGQEKGVTTAPKSSGGPQRRIRRDGTVEITYPDGTTTRIPPDASRGIPGLETNKPADANTASSPGVSDADPMIPLSPHSGLFDQPTKEKYLDALRGYYDYRIVGYQHRQEVFRWQFFSSKVIFVVVLVLVFVGIYFAAVQFHSALGRKLKSESSESGERTEFVASFKGIKVSSPVLGVVILVISLVFFYLYLVYVYPIKAVF